MQALPSTDPRNWTRQAQIHNDHCPHANWYFLPWHRAYLVFFERICRKLTGSTDFALPYWNWTSDSKVPDVFWGTGNPLFDSSRFIHQGDPLDQGSIGHATLEGILQEVDFQTFASRQAIGQRDRAGYGRLEGTPHNYVHGAIGGDMGNFMSPLDPVFWTHHNMIEYCWVDWNINRKHGNTNDTGWNNFTFSDFFDENGNSTSVTVAVTLLFPVFDYQYENDQIGLTPTMNMHITKSNLKTLKTFVQRGSNVRINILQRFPIQQLTTVVMGQTAALSIPMQSDALSAVLEKSDQRLLLNVNNVKQPSTADFFVRAFIDAPGANAETPITDPHFAGSFAFFLGDHGAHEDSAQAGFVVDVTDTVRRLNRAGSLPSMANVDVQLVAVPFPGRQITNQSFSLESMELATSRITSK